MSTILEAAMSGVRRDLLVAMRDLIATELDGRDVQARDLASLTRRLLEITREIEAIDADGATDEVGVAAASPDESWAD